jgi:hypothetical protein
VGVWAHGLGGRTDLPLDAAAAIAGGGAAVTATFLALTVAWRRPRLDPAAGRPLPAALARALDAPPLTALARTAALATAAFVVVTALAGPADDRANLAPWALYVTFWVGLVPVSVLAGPVWRRVNPLRTLHAALCRLTGADPAGRRSPDRLGYWPAALALAAFVWLELVAPNRSDPRLVGALLLGYAAAQLAAAGVYGRGWFGRGDAFEVYSTLLARMCPIGRAPGGALVWRTPLTGLLASANGPGGGERGLAAVACVLIGSTGFDGITRTTYWRDHVDPGDVLAGTAGLAAAIAAVAAAYTAATAAMGAPAGERGLADRFAGTLLPVALGYTIAHYFSFLLLEGQMTVILASDPLGTGADLLGTRGHRVDHDLAGPALVAQVQVNAIVLGHLAATLAAHELALRRLPTGGVRAQAPLAAVMVALTCAGLFALLSG